MSGSYKWPSFPKPLCSPLWSACRRGAAGRPCDVCECVWEEVRACEGVIEEVKGMVVPEGNCDIRE